MKMAKVLSLIMAFALCLGLFTGDFTFSGVTGESITWEDNGYVSKSAVKYVIKEATK